MILRNMRIGILGAGGISDTHVRAAHEIAGVQVVAVHGANPDKTAALARMAGAVPYDHLEAFLAHPMDIVANRVRHGPIIASRRR